jgi:hypothetical protein
MAIPILLTVSALGVGWVALSKKRATMNDAPVTAPDEPQAEVAPTDEGIEAATMVAEPVTIGDNGIAGTESGGAVAMTADTSASGGAGFAVQALGSLGGSDPATLMSAPAAPAEEESRSDAYVASCSSCNTAKAYYGTTDGLSKTQEAYALAELGPLAGEVW